jgi:hypothetical protein
MVAWQCAWQLKQAIKPHKAKAVIWGLLGFEIAKHQLIL